MGQAVFKRIQFPCNYFGDKLAGFQAGTQPTVLHIFSCQDVMLSPGVVHCLYALYPPTKASAFSPVFSLALLLIDHSAHPHNPLT